MVSNSFSVPADDKHGEQREAKDAKHNRHGAKCEPTSRCCFLKGQHRS